jgi:serum/glucocorticoid-regulated kinase 2
VGKQQQRILLLTTKNLYNILPDGTFMSIFTRIKRKIPWSNIKAMTVSRFGKEFVVHVENEHDYRFEVENVKMKVVETIVDLYCKSNLKKMALYYYDDYTLENYTTTIDDADKSKKKVHENEALYLDA